MWAFIMTAAGPSWLPDRDRAPVVVLTLYALLRRCSPRSSRRSKRSRGESAAGSTTVLRPPRWRGAVYFAVIVALPLAFIVVMNTPNAAQCRDVQPQFAAATGLLLVPAAACSRSADG